VQKHRPPGLDPGKDALLEVKNLTQRPKFQNVTFHVNRGEVLGIAGMLGSGRTELLRAIFGADTYDSGEIFLEGKPVKVTSPRAANRMGIAMIPENRKEQALVLPHSIRQNMSLASLYRVGKHGYITQRMEQDMAGPLIQRLAIKLTDAGHAVESLSGGNQQKVVVGKWLNIQPRLILFDEPTRGIDLQAKQHIFEIMWNLSRQGISSIVVSSELEELLEICHRILIMKAGAIVEEVKPENLTIDALVLRCMENSAPVGEAA
jgi:ribose transport system ATP-binding protein